MEDEQKNGPELSSNSGPTSGKASSTFPTHILTRAQDVDNIEPGDYHALVLQAALGFAASGWYVFPCRPEDKRPLTEHGFKDASQNQAMIRTWWERWPKALIGVDCGRSGLVVIDCDTKNGEDGPGNWL